MSLTSDNSMIIQNLWTKGYTLKKIHMTEDAGLSVKQIPHLSVK